MKHSFVSICLCACLLLFAACAFAQSSTSTVPAAPSAAAGIPSISLPTYVMAGAAFNQTGSPRANIFASAIYPIVTDAGVYSSTTADILPVKALNAAGKPYYTFQTTVRQGVHKVVYTKGKLTLLLGGDAGAAFSPSSPSGTNVNLAASFTATPVIQVSKSWAVGVPIRGLYTPQLGWTFVPEIGAVFKP